MTTKEEDGWSQEEEEHDLTEHEIDLYGVLGLTRPQGDELLKDDREETHTSTVARLRVAYHRRATKWHPSNFKSSPLVCDVSGVKLGFQKGWYHFVGDVYDLCHDEYEILDEADKKMYQLILKQEDLADDLFTYAPELQRQEKRDKAIIKFKEVGLAYKVLRDLELRRIYHSCGWRGLVKAESYAESSVFDADFFGQFEDFFAGKDEDDRQYLLLNGPNALSDEEEEFIHATCDDNFVVTAAATTGCSNGEEEEEGGGDGEDGEEEEEIDLDLAAAAAAAAAAAPKSAALRSSAAPTLPKPPAEVAVTLMVRPENCDDPIVLRQDHWANISKKLSGCGEEEAGGGGGDSIAETVSRDSTEAPLGPPLKKARGACKS
jgi:hypothetical protein